MTALTEITFEANGVRMFGTKYDPWFVGKDVCDILGYKNHNKAIKDHVDDEDKGVTECYTPGGIQTMVIVNESGLYSLIFGSDLPAAKQFKRWVTHEVLPQIRKTGKYIPPQPKRSRGRPALPMKTYEISTGERKSLNDLRAMCLAFEKPEYNYESRFMKATAEECIEFINAEISAGHKPHYDTDGEFERDEIYWIVVDGKRIEIPK